MSKFQSSVFVLLFVFALQNADALKCILCISDVHPTCLGHKDIPKGETSDNNYPPNILDAFLAPCAEPTIPLAENTTLACSVRRQELPGGYAIVSRSCSLAPKNKLPADDCGTSEPAPGVNKETCHFCAEDGCNAQFMG